LPTLRTPRGTLIAIAMLVASAASTLNTPARADPDLLVWRIAHEQMVAKWRRAEPRCGWTVGGYECARHKRWAANRAK
jgi:hypothetical protein